MLNIFSYAYLSHLCIFFGEVLGHLLVFKLCCLLLLLMNFKSSSYILDNSPLSDMHFASIFSQSVTYLLIFLTWPRHILKFIVSCCICIGLELFQGHARGSLKTETFNLGAP